MKWSTFRLQPVLELRRTEERTAASAAAEGGNEVTDADRCASDYDMTVAGAVVTRVLSSTDLVHGRTLMRTAATDGSAARAFATASAEQEEMVRAEWTDAAHHTKGLQKLNER